MYIAILEFRTWYSSDQIGKNLNIKRLQLQDWIQKLKLFIEVSSYEHIKLC
jgi:hypothetical protein